MAIAARDIRAAARLGFGYRTLRDGQQEAIAALADGRDVVAVMPTGFGKPAIYQVAGLLVDGPTVVVSPLIALSTTRSPPSWATARAARSWPTRP